MDAERQLRPMMVKMRQPGQIDETAKTITIVGSGAFLGLPKAHQHCPRWCPSR